MLRKASVTKFAPRSTGNREYGVCLKFRRASYDLASENIITIDRASKLTKPFGEDKVGHHVVFTDKGEQNETRYFIQADCTSAEYLTKPEEIEHVNNMLAQGLEPVAKPAAFDTPEGDRLNIARDYEAAYAKFLKGGGRTETSTTSPQELAEKDNFQELVRLNSESEIAMRTHLSNIKNNDHRPGCGIRVASDGEKLQPIWKQQILEEAALETVETRITALQALDGIWKDEGRMQTLRAAVKIGEDGQLTSTENDVQKIIRELIKTGDLHGKSVAEAGRELIEALQSEGVKIDTAAAPNATKEAGIKDNFEQPDKVVQNMTRPVTSTEMERDHT